MVSSLKSLRESRHFTTPTPRQAKEPFNWRWILLGRRSHYAEETFPRGEICESAADFNQTWRPFILRMLWLQCVWLYAEQRSGKMQTVEHVFWPVLVFVLRQQWAAKIANFAQYLRGFHWVRLHCEYDFSVFLVVLALLLLWLAFRRFKIPQVAPK